jgi:hypothetical protein
MHQPAAAEGTSHSGTSCAVIVDHFVPEI